MNKEGFETWLENNTQLSAHSISKYIGAIRTLSFELKNYGFISETSLYSFSDLASIHSILENSEFKKKNDKGNKMYSSALKYFKQYINYANAYEEYQNELVKEEREFDKYLQEQSTKSSDINIIDERQDKPDPKKVSNKTVWSRDHKKASKAIAVVNYLCEYDSKHKYFTSKFNYKNYVEAHHLIPMQYQNEFDYSLDVNANIVSLCVVCHKKIHYSLFDGKKDLLDKLFDNRKDRLKNCGIDVGIRDIYRFYQD